LPVSTPACSDMDSLIRIRPWWQSIERDQNNENEARPYNES